MNTMLKLRIIAVGIFLVLIGIPSSARAVAAIELLEVTGTLERVAPEEGGGEVITLNVYGKEASGPLDPSCQFLDERGQPMEKNDFLRRYMKRIVTLELEANSGVVLSCRLGS